jgi:lipopolysaccharide/colanic/teichoic acid biosynthesis glycosyltransferase
MVIFRRAELDQTIDYSGFAGRGEPRAEDIVDRAVALRHAPSAKLRAAIVAKRVFDVVVGSFALALLSPVFVIAAIAIAIDSGGPIFFKQERIGINRRRDDRRARPAVGGERRRRDRRRATNAGRPFKIYKFRTMVQNAERGVPTLACENDPRITRIGRIMRKTRIDEIPQFFNVIRGDMSIIGPRPERSFFIDEVGREMPEFAMRLMVKPGITGLAQVEHGYTTTVGEMKGKLFYDLKYISELSVMQEIRILFKTFYVVVTGKGAC